MPPKGGMDWKLQPPKSGQENKIIKFDGKDWNFCTHHAKWAIKNGRFGKHTSKTCRLNPDNQEEGDNKRGRAPKEMKTTKNKKVTVDPHAVGLDPDFDDDGRWQLQRRLQ